MSDDIVAELDRWLGTYDPDQLWATFPPALVQRARDEIVALRRIVNGLVASGARAAALEEAAQACVGSGAIVAEARLCASAIRALKDERHG